jgi:hypothetical protein
MRSVQAVKEDPHGEEMRSIVSNHEAKIGTRKPLAIKMF